MSAAGASKTVQRNVTITGRGTFAGSAFWRRTQEAGSSGIRANVVPSRNRPLDWERLILNAAQEHADSSRQRPAEMA